MSGESILAYFSETTVTSTPVSTLQGMSCPRTEMVHVQKVSRSEPMVFRKAKSSRDSGGLQISPTDFKRHSAL